VPGSQREKIPLEKGYPSMKRMSTDGRNSLDTS
jgi:hypothetical protein